MHRVGHGLEVVVGQDHAGRGFHVRCKDHGGLFLRNRGRHFGNRGGCPGGLGRIADAAGLEHRVAFRDLAHVEDLRPAEAEPAVADHHDMLSGGELARDRLHAEGATAGHQRHRMGFVDLLEHARDVGHHAAKPFGHVVERPVGVDHREFEQAIGVDVGQQAGHGGSPFSEIRRKSLPELTQTGRRRGWRSGAAHGLLSRCAPASRPNAAPLRQPGSPVQRPRLTLSSSSSISRPAPSVMALSARLKAGKCQPAQ